jgi:glyoxylase-like metal-dependent hydrolase (beta-lactamase superfamily II)/rhodanese-related sulfurtransferase
VDVDLFVTEGLGDNSYLLSSGDEAAAIDPQRDVGRIVEAARSRGAAIRYVVETHVHNDYVSGAAELRAATGAEIVGPAEARYAFEHRPVSDGDELAVGDATLVAVSTPGHTFEHTAYLLRGPEAERPSALFSGGSLIVGSAGRTDLLGADRTDELTRLQYRTMRRLDTFGDDVTLLPTHGAGSFCTTSPPGRDRTSSLGLERGRNPALRAPDEAAFVREQLDGLTRYPSYYAHMAPINRAGPPVHGEVPVPPPRSPDEIRASMEAGVPLVDTRPGDAFARAHVPRSLNIPLEASFASYVGWLLPFGEPLTLLVEDHEALVEASTQLFRIGVERIEGSLEGGIDAWREAGGELAAIPTVDVGALVAELRDGRGGDVLDVRQPTEWAAGHLEGSRHLFVADVPGRLGEFDRRSTTTVICVSGYRSAMAASVLHREGIPVRLVADGGVPRALRALRASG